MHRLEVRLPKDRKFCGSLTLFSPDGVAVLGPIAVAGKSGEQLASEKYNPARTSLLPYGDTPTGSYRFSRLLSMRNATQIDVARYGRFGVAIFDPCEGDAALAEAAGRFELWFHGGSPLSSRLLSTAGSIRLFDEDQQRLMRALGRCDAAVCVILSDQAVLGNFGLVDDDGRSDYNDPPALQQAANTPPYEGALIRSLTYAQNPGLLYLGEYDSGQYFSSVDVSYVIKNEGGIVTTLMVPRAGDGYTIGGGVNLSAQSQQGLLDMGVSQSIVNALSSVIGVWPPNGTTSAPNISLSTTDATALTTAVMNSYFNTVGQSYSNNCSFANFTDLPTQAQTALADLQYNLPDGVSNGAPTLWSQVTSGNWQAAINNLTGTNGQPPFSSQDATLNARAKRDGALLQQALTAGTLPKP
jgi:Bacterial toxin homologue of phage lysozyme, C-term